VVACEALQCPTLLRNGFGGHRLEGIGDKHVPWIHNVRNTDFVVAVDDDDPLALIRLFNDPVGHAYLASRGVPAAFVEQLDLLGISGIGNLLAAIKVARWNELDEHDAIFTVFTDSMELYGSRLAEAAEQHGAYTREQAAVDFFAHLRGVKTDHMEELDHWGRKRIHNLKYFTWIEQQQRELAELNAQWFDARSYWPARWRMADAYDELIVGFNARTGLANKYA
jgi:hypothetical protein